VIADGLVVGVLWSTYAARDLASDTDISHLLSTHLPWRQHESAFEKEFPQRSELTLAVLQAPTGENAKRAAEALMDKLAERKDIFRSVRQSGGGPFFDRNGLLYQPTEEVAKTT